VIARSNWLLNQVDLRGWAHSLKRENADDVVRIGRGAHMLLLLTPPVQVESSIIDAYWIWIEDKLLAPVKEQFPELYEWLVNWNKEQVRKLIVTDGSIDGSP
jgi:hypothetical protein